MKNRLLRSRRVWLLGAGFLAAAAMLSATLVAPGTDTKAASKFTVAVGGGGKGISVEAFRPKDIFVHAGDTVEFVNSYEEIHTVTFPGSGKVPDFIIPAGAPPAGAPPKLIVNPVVSNPTTKTSYDGTYANSGVLGKGQSFTLAFNTKGTFTFVCVLHPGMEGNVHVLDDGSTVPAQAAINFDAANQLEAAINAGLKSVAAAKPTTTKNANGTTTWGVEVPASVGLSDPMQFAPATLKVGVGDTVTWNNPNFVPHTVSYTAGQPIPPFALPEFGPSGPPTIVLDPKVLFPVNAGKDFTGTGYVNSGFLGIGPEATAGQSFSLTFNKAGTYLFVCILHADQGMSSVVTVGGGGVTPPSTGDAGLAASSQPVEVYAGLAALAVLVMGALSVGALRIRNR